MNHPMRAKTEASAAAAHPRAGRQTLAQQSQGGVRPAFLHDGERHIGHEQSADHRRFHAFAGRKLQQDGRFEHPRRRRPEMAQRAINRTLARLRHRIGAEFREPPAQPPRW